MGKRALHSSIVLVAALSACGGDGDGQAGSSGVDAKKQITALSDDDARALCEFQRDRYKAGLPDESAFCAYFSNDLPMSACEEERDTCIELDDYENELEDDWECGEVRAEDFTEEVDDSCSATLGELERCLKDSTDARLAAMAKAACGEDEQDEDYPESCQVLDEKCPGSGDEG